VRINATTVRLGIDAPTKLVVVREELTTNSDPERAKSNLTAPAVAK
jgi:sRNA-binding carbon storage regulator CsrA